jgi:hypothetical protein
VTVLPKASRAVTVIEKVTFGVSVVGPDIVKCVAGPAATVIVPEVPVIDAVTVSVPVRVWLPAVFRVAEKVPTPLVNVAFAGNTAWPSLLVKCTVPLYPVAVRLDASNAVTVNVNAVPAVAEAGADTVK